MRRLTAGLVLLGAVAGCGNLPTGDDGVVALELTVPTTLTLVEGQSVQLSARALDRNGEVVSAATITWRTPDTTVVVDAATGLVTAVTGTGTGRVQAATGSLHSDIVTFTLQAASGT